MIFSVCAETVQILYAKFLAQKVCGWCCVIFKQQTAVQLALGKETDFRNCAESIYARYRYHAQDYRNLSAKCTFESRTSCRYLAQHCSQPLSAEVQSVQTHSPIVWSRPSVQASLSSRTTLKIMCDTSLCTANTYKFYWFKCVYFHVCHQQCFHYKVDDHP